MARKLKVYTAIAIRKHEGMPAPEGKGHHRQVRMIVATTSQKMAAGLADMTLSDWRWNGGTQESGPDFDAAMANPGAVLWDELDNYGDRRSPKVWRTAEEAEEGRLRRIAAKEAADARQAAYKEEYDQARARRQQSNQAARDWAVRLQEEFGLECEGADSGKVEITTSAEALYGHLVRISGELRDMGLDPLWLGAVQPE